MTPFWIKYQVVLKPLEVFLCMTAARLLGTTQVLFSCSAIKLSNSLFTSENSNFLGVNRKPELAWKARESKEFLFKWYIPPIPFYDTTKVKITNLLKKSTVEKKWSTMSGVMLDYLWSNVLTNDSEKPICFNISQNVSCRAFWHSIPLLANYNLLSFLCFEF